MIFLERKEGLQAVDIKGGNILWTKIGHENLGIPVSLVATPTDVEFWSWEWTTCQFGFTKSTRVRLQLARTYLTKAKGFLTIHVHFGKQVRKWVSIYIDVYIYINK